LGKWKDKVEEESGSRKWKMKEEGNVIKENRRGIWKEKNVEEEK
jgi:hypothetical protein